MFVLRIDRTREVRQPLDELLAWIRNPESRSCWPGASNIRVRHEWIFYYDVVLPGSKENAPLSIEEHVRAVQPVDGGFEFESGFLLTWPWSNDEVASGWSTYRFTESGDQRTLTYSFRYLVPGKTGERLRPTTVRVDDGRRRGPVSGMPGGWRPFPDEFAGLSPGKAL